MTVSKEQRAKRKRERNNRLSPERKTRLADANWALVQRELNGASAPPPGWLFVLVQDKPPVTCPREFVQVVFHLRFERELNASLLPLVDATFAAGKIPVLVSSDGDWFEVIEMKPVLQSKGGEA